MRRIAFLVAISSSMAFLPIDAIQAGSPNPYKIDDPSDWDVVITYPGGAKQNAYIRLRNGIIYPHPKMNNNASGKMHFDDDGYLHAIFDGHPKVAVGEAVIEKVRPGHWRGVLLQQSGKAHFEMKRAKK